MTLSLIEIDHFKPYTDFHGHSEGERCIKTVEDCMKSVLSNHEGIFGNLCSGSFVCFLSNISSCAFAQFADDLNKAVEKLGLLFCWEQHSFRVTISIGGFHGLRSQFKDKAEMVTVAEEELMKAKMIGQNKVKIKCYQPKLLDGSSSFFVFLEWNQM